MLRLQCLSPHRLLELGTSRDVLEAWQKGEVSPAGKCSSLAASTAGSAARQPQLSLSAVPGSGQPYGVSGANPAAHQRLQRLGIRAEIMAGASSSMAPGQGQGAPGNDFASLRLGMVPGAPQHPFGTRCSASPVSLHLKKPVPPCYLHTLRSASPPAAAVQYFYLSARFPVCNPHAYGCQAAGGRRPGGHWPGGHGPPAAHPTRSWLLLEELRHWKRQQLPLKGLFQLLSAAGHGDSVGGFLKRPWEEERKELFFF